MSDMRRREFIKLMATTSLLPLVNVQNLLAATTTTPPLRFLFIPIQHGWGIGAEENIGSFSGTFSNFTLPEIWTPFEPIKDQCMFIDGLRSGIYSHITNAHDHSYTEILTAGVPLDLSKTGGDFPKPANASIDSVISQFYGTKPLLFSQGYKSWGLNYHPLTWDDRLVSQPYYTSGKSAYDSLKTQIEGTTIPPTSDLVYPHIFSLLGARAQLLLNMLGGDEKLKLEKYLSSANNMKSKLDSASNQNGGIAKITKIPVTGQTRSQELDSYLDMIKVAFTNNSHQVAVLGFGEFDNGFMRSSQIQNASADFHEVVAHYGGTNPYGVDAKNAMKSWTQWYIQKVVAFVQSLSGVIDFDGNSLLDNTIIVLTGEVANGMHDTRAKGHILIGGGARISRGRWMKAPTVSAVSRQGFKIDTRNTSGSIVTNDAYWGANFAKYTQADLFTQLANLAGLNLTSFGLDTMNSSYNSMPNLNLKS